MKTRLLSTPLWMRSALPKNTDQEKKQRSAAIQAATKHAIEVPFEVMKTAFQSMETLLAMATIGNPNSISDAGVGALCARTAVYGAYLNVRINAGGLNDKNFASQITEQAKGLLERTMAKESEILDMVERRL